MTEAHIKHLFHTYRSRPDSTYSGLFFSPTCMQICRPIPTFAATTREQILRYQKDADEGVLELGDGMVVTEGVGQDTKVTNSAEELKRWYSIHLIHRADATFGTMESCASINTTPERLSQQAKEEGWVGMRVDMWDESAKGVVVKVQYWWREEDVGEGEEVHGDEGGRGWRQCLHDILYLGVKDGSEGMEGEVRERGW